jgi:methionyl aminopeptidase
LRLVDAAQEALEAAIAVAGPGVPVRRVSEAIASALRRFAAHPMRTLCGHHVGRWTVHSPPPIPNVPEDSSVCLAPDAVLAIEPFATEGSGLVAEGGPPEVFRLVPGREDGVDLDPALLEALRRRRGLPFSRRDLGGFARPLVEETLVRLRRSGALAEYPPLLERGGRPVAQAEHTLYVGPEGVEVLTR